MKKTKSFQSRSSLAATLTLALFTLTANSASAISEKFTTSGTFTPPAGVTSITVECWGGGGAGGSAQRTTATCGGSGGGGGAYAMKLNIPVTSLTSYTVTIPAAATAPASGFTNNQQCSSGASVTFTGDSGVSVTANGGTGGYCGLNATGNPSGLGGVAGANDLDFAGGSGSRSPGNGGGGGGAASDLGPGNAASTTTAGAAKAGSDSDHNGGVGGAGRTGAGAGNAPASGIGGGGAGAKVNATGTQKGGAGAKGQIIITYSGGAVTKANNTDNLNLDSSWVSGTAPDAAGTAKWDNTVTSANTTVLGADLAWGSIVIADPSDLVTINAGNTLTNNGGIDMSSATADLTLNCDYALGNSAIWNVATSRTLTLGGIVSGSFNITEQGAGTVILSAANTYSGATAINGGTLQLGASDVIPDGSGMGDVSVAATCTLDLNSYSETINGLSGAGIVDNTAAGTTATLTVGSNNVTSTFSGVIQNTGSSSTNNLIKTGSGQLVLSGVNTFTGTATINEGNLTVQNINALGSISGLTIAGGTQLGLNANNTVISAPITLGGNATVIVSFQSMLLSSLNGAIGGTGNLTFTTGTNTLAGADTKIAIGAGGDFEGDVTITTGRDLNNMTVRLGVANALPTTALVTLDGIDGNVDVTEQWCDLDLNGFDQTLAGLKTIARTNRLQRVYSDTAATLTISNSVNYTFGGTLGKVGGDDLSLTKSGAGTFTISGANSYTGATTVTGGTLALGASDVLADTTEVSIGSATLAAGAGFTDTVGTLDTTGAATINLGAGAALAFADSSAVDWTGGTLNLNGTFVSGASLRFGDGTGTGLTSTQLALISATGFSGFGLDASGYLTATSTGGFSSWITGTFANGTVPALQQGANADPDNDGISNLVEYAVAGQDPTVANAAVGTFAANVLSYTKRADANGLTYAIEESTDLGLADVWADVTPTVNSASTISYTLPVGPAKDFIRLKVLSN